MPKEQKYFIAIVAVGAIILLVLFNKHSPVAAMVSNGGDADTGLGTISPDAGTSMFFGSPAAYPSSSYAIPPATYAPSSNNGGGSRGCGCGDSGFLPATSHALTGALMASIPAPVLKSTTQYVASHINLEPQTSALMKVGFGGGF